MNQGLQIGRPDGRIILIPVKKNGEWKDTQFHGQTELIELGL